MVKPQRKLAKDVRLPSQRICLSNSSASSSGQATQFPFLRLPVEIQEMILKYLLVGAVNWLRTSETSAVSGTRIPNCYFYGKRKNLEEDIERERSVRPSRPNYREANLEKMHIALTCKHLYTESLRIYFGENRFLFSDFYKMREFLVRIGHERRQYIKYLTVMFDGRLKSPIKPAVRVLDDCVHLSELTIAVNCPRSSYWLYTSEDRKNLLKAGGVSTLKKLKGLQKVTVTMTKSCYDDSCETGCFDNPEELEAVLNKAMCVPKTVIKPKRKYTKLKDADRKGKVSKTKSKVTAKN
ncbi:hypothetical protein BJ875DRAFT_445097 [Amylocarpus encephaloides]|uniref:DUF7730 domain-containing protein n=1 Tax=Amylocarpus encephaloides TaxID=45428 RepID=A0A9P8C1E2_9HELO|nr:hypothetical protein BJ875DRAFT_445097 [Amylocarpus encephaloides]